MKSYLLFWGPKYTRRGRDTWQILRSSRCRKGFPGGSVVKNPPAMQETPELGRSPGEGNGNPLQYSCQENPMDRGAWWAAVYGVTKESGMTWRLNSNKKEKNPVNGRICRTVIMGSPRLNPDPGIRLTHDPGQR